MSHEATLIHIDRLIQYLKEQDDTTLCHKFFLKKLQAQVKKKRFQKKKKKLTFLSKNEMYINVMAFSFQF